MENVLKKLLNRASAIASLGEKECTKFDIKMPNVKYTLERSVWDKLRRAFRRVYSRVCVLGAQGRAKETAKVKEKRFIRSRLHARGIFLRGGGGIAGAIVAPLRRRKIISSSHDMYLTFHSRKFAKSKI